MPMYDLICPKCRNEQDDVLLKITEDKPDCPQCGTKMNVNYKNMEYGIQKKGDGWTPKFHRRDGESY